MTRRADLEVRRGDLLHLGLELLEVFGREGPLEGEVVVEAVFDDRADGHLRLRVDSLHRLREQVRGGVADDLERRRILLRDDGQLARRSSMTNDVSTSLPFTRPASAALARPAPMLAATSATVTGASNFFWLPSGSVMTGIVSSFRENRIKQLEGPRILPKRLAQNQFRQGAQGLG